jgi:spermidine synthase
MANHYLEMLVHVSLSTHKEPQKVLVVTDRKDKIENELEKQKLFLNLETTFSDSEGFKDLESESFDVAIFDNADLDEVSISHINRILNSHGVVSSSGNFETLKKFSSVFRIAMPYLTFEIEEKSEVSILASKFYHPTADINLQRADFIDNCEYYNSDTHTSSFVMPNYIKNQIRDFVRN